MKKKTDEIDNKILEGLAQGKSQTEIAKTLNLTRQRVSQRVMKLKEFGLEVPDNLKVIDDKILNLIYEGKTKVEIAEELKMDTQIITSKIARMKHSGIKVPKFAKKNDAIDDKIVEGLAQGKTQREIAENVKMPTTSVCRRIGKMLKRGVVIERYKPKRRPKDKNDEIDDLILEGINNKKSNSKIAKELGISDSTVYNRINEMRNRGIEVKKKKYVMVPRDFLDEKLAEGLAEGKTQTQIAKDLEIGRSTISRRYNKLLKEGKIAPQPKKENVKPSAKIEKLKAKDAEKLASMIVDLIKTKNATEEQVIKLGEYYGVDTNKILKPLRDKNKER